MDYLEAVVEGVLIYSRLPDNSYINKMMFVMRRGWSKPTLAEFAIYDMLVRYKEFIEKGYPSGLFGWIAK